jgi:hypothetical protein
MNRLRLSVALFLIAGLAIACTRPWHPPETWPPPTPTPSCPNQQCGDVPYETVSQGNSSFPPDSFIPQTHVIRDQVAWEQFWTDDATRPNIDFFQNVIVAVEDSWLQPQGGVPVRIERVVASSSALTIEAVMALNSCTSQLASHHVVKISWTALSAEFEWTLEPIYCPY